MKNLCYIIGRLCCIFVLTLASAEALSAGEKGVVKDWAEALRNGTLWEMGPRDVKSWEPIADYGMLCREAISFDGVEFGSRSLWFWERSDAETRIDKRLASTPTRADKADIGKLMRISTLFQPSTMTAESALEYISNAVGVAPQKRKPRPTALNYITRAWVFELPGNSGAIMLEDIQSSATYKTVPRLRLTLARNVESLFYARTDSDHLATPKELARRVRHDEEGYVWLDGIGLWGIARPWCLVGTWYGLFSHDCYDYTLGSFTIGFSSSDQCRRHMESVLKYEQLHLPTPLEHPQSLEDMDKSFKIEPKRIKDAWWKEITQYLDAGIPLVPNEYAEDWKNEKNRSFKWQPPHNSSTINYYPGSYSYLIIGYNRKKETLLMTYSHYPYYCEAPAHYIFYLVGSIRYFGPGAVGPKHDAKKKKSSKKRR